MPISEYLDRNPEEFKEAKLFSADVIINESTIYGFMKISDKGKIECKYTPYSLDGISKRSIVANNDEYGYNLSNVSHLLKYVKPYEINIPNGVYPAYFNVGSGYIMLLAPFMVEGSDNVHKLKQPVQTLGKFF